ncbi:MAG: ABC transporter substrate-binding protein [Bacteroidota bacterium]
MFNHLLSLVLACAIALPALGQSESAQIKTMLQTRDAQIKKALGTSGSLSAAQKDEVKQLVNGAISFNAMSEAVLGPHWADLTPTQRTEFVEVFAQIVREQSLADLEPYRAKVSYGDVEVSGTKATARTTASVKNVTTTVAYQLAKINGDWKVTDISLDNVSTVEGYARSFRNVIRKRGFETLMKSLNRRLEKMTQK